MVTKAILLARYVNLVKAFISGKQRKMPQALSCNVHNFCVLPLGTPVTKETGIPSKASKEVTELQEKLKLTPESTELFALFAKHYKAEAEALADDDLKKELKVLDDIMETYKPVEGGA